MDLRYLLAPLIKLVISSFFSSPRLLDHQSDHYILILLLKYVSSLLIAILTLLFLLFSIKLSLARAAVYLRGRNFSVLVALSLLCSVFLAPAHFWMVYPLILFISPWESLVFNVIKWVFSWLYRTLEAIPDLTIVCITQQQKEDHHRQVEVEAEIDVLEGHTGQEQVNLEEAGDAFAVLINDGDEVEKKGVCKRGCRRSSEEEIVVLSSIKATGSIPERLLKLETLCFPGARTPILRYQFLSAQIPSPVLLDLLSRDVPVFSGMDHFAIELHHGGYFVTKPILHYLGGNVTMFKDLDPDRMSFFELKGMINDLGYKTFSKLYYRDPSTSFAIGLRLLISDNEIDQMLNEAKKTGSLQMYVDHCKINEGDNGEVRQSEVNQGDNFGELGQGSFTTLLQNVLNEVRYSGVNEGGNDNESQTESDSDESVAHSLDHVSDDEELIAVREKILRMKSKSKSQSVSQNQTQSQLQTDDDHISIEQLDRNEGIGGNEEVGIGDTLQHEGIEDRGQGIPVNLNEAPLTQNSQTNSNVPSVRRQSTPKRPTRSAT
ncbi:hypothetical protein LguiA_033781 [Lonicera macranthoides]